MRGAFFSVIAGAGLLGACQATTARYGDPVTVRYYIPSEIVVGTQNVGSFEVANGCIFFHYEKAPQPLRVAALFPTGSRLSHDGRSIFLPNGQSIPFGTTVSVQYERPPNRPGVDESCGPQPIEVLNVTQKE